MHYAVVISGGKQYRVSVGDIIEVDRLPLDKASEVVFDKVLLFRSGEDIKIGTPTLSGVKVIGNLLENIRGEKIHVTTFKAKARFRKNRGFRAALSKVQITKILAT